MGGNREAVGGYVGAARGGAMPHSDQEKFANPHMHAMHPAMHARHAGEATSGSVNRTVQHYATGELPDLPPDPKNPLVYSQAVYNEQDEFVDNTGKYKLVMKGAVFALKHDIEKMKEETCKCTKNALFQTDFSFCQGIKFLKFSNCKLHSLGLLQSTTAYSKILSNSSCINKGILCRIKVRLCLCCKKCFNQFMSALFVLLAGSYAAVEVALVPGDSVKAESGSMVSMSTNVHMHSKMEGTAMQALTRCCCSGESMFLTYYTLKPGEVRTPLDLPYQH